MPLPARFECEPTAVVPGTAFQSRRGSASTNVSISTARLRSQESVFCPYIEKPSSAIDDARHAGRIAQSRACDRAALGEVGAHELKLARCPRGRGVCLPRPRLAHGGAAVLADVIPQRAPRPFKRHAQHLNPPPDQLKMMLKPERERAMERKAMLPGRDEELDVRLEPKLDPPSHGKKAHVPIVHRPSSRQHERVHFAGPVAASPREEPIWYHRRHFRKVQTLCLHDGSDALREAC